MRTLLLNKLIFLDPSVPVASISRNDAVTRRASICLVGVLTYTRRDRLWANWYALVIVADVIVVTIGSNVIEGSIRVQKGETQSQYNLPFVILVLARTTLLVLDRVSELVADIAVGASLAAPVPLLFHAHQRTYSRLK